MLNSEEIKNALKFCSDCPGNINHDILDLITYYEARIQELEDTEMFCEANDY